jgi:sodium/hydrogen antiporter
MFFTTVGPAGGAAAVVDLKVHGEQVKLLAEITLTLVLFADAPRISVRALRHESAVPLRLLGIGLPLTIVAGAVIGAAVLPGVSFAEAVVLAIVLACTDAALGQAVVSDERVPSRIRNIHAGALGRFALRLAAPTAWCSRTPPTRGGSASRLRS